ncbi:hypothetical protein IAU59_006984 [Kwoniella sp. CBS 9459]
MASTDNSTSTGSPPPPPSRAETSPRAQPQAQPNDPTPSATSTRNSSTYAATPPAAALPCPRMKTPPPPVSYVGYYYGIPSNPRLLARSNPSSSWQRSNPNYCNFPSEKAIFPIDPTHPVKHSWDFPIGQRLLSIIDHHTPHATSVDIVKVCWDWLADTSPPIIWIGVTPGEVPVETAEELVRHINAFLKECKLDDVEVEVKESEIFRLAGTGTRSAPKLHHPIYIDGGAPNFDSKISTAIGLGITTPHRPDSTGTSSFYLRDRSRPDEVLLLTAQHVISGTGSETLCGEDKSSERRDLDMWLKHPRFRKDAQQAARPTRPVRLSDTYLEILSSKIGQEIRWKQQEYGHFDQVANDVTAPMDKRQLASMRRDMTQEDLGDLQRLQKHIRDGWEGDENTTLGSLMCCPPVTYGVGSFGGTEDWALIRVDPDKLPLEEYGPLANLLYLPREHYFEVEREEPGASITWGGMMRLHGILTQADVRHGPLNVLVAGAVSGLRRGYLMPVDSMIKPAFAHSGLSHPTNPDIKHKVENRYGEWSGEWAAMPPVHEQFSLPPPPVAQIGDSGAGVVALDGRIGGIVTCANGLGPRSSGGPWEKIHGCVDITYVTPMHHLLERFVAHGIKDPQFL